MHEGDVLVVALGADYDLDATPGLAEGGNEFYSVAGAERLAELLPDFTDGRALVGVCGAPFKCPPAPSEAALLLHDHLTEKGGPRPLRDHLRPPPLEARAAVPRDLRGAPRSGLRRARHRPSCRGGRVESAGRGPRGSPVVEDGAEFPYDLFLGVPKHRAPAVVIESGMTEEGYVPVDSADFGDALPGRLRGRRRRHGRRAQGGGLRRGGRPGRRGRCDRGARPRRGRPPATGAPAPATSSSAPAASAGSTSTSSPARSRPAPSGRPPASSSPRRSTSAPAAPRAGSAARRA